MDVNLSLPEACARIDPCDLAAFLEKLSETYVYWPDQQLLGLVDYLGITLSAVQFPWLKMFKESPWPKLIDVIDVPFSHIPEPVYKISVDWLDQFSHGTLASFVVWSLDHILQILAPPQQPGGETDPQRTSYISDVAIFVALSMILRSQPESLVMVLPNLKQEYVEYQLHEKLPFLVWMMAQASQGDLSVGLFSWAYHLLPVAFDSKPQSKDLILQLVEMILSNPNARNILVNGLVLEEHRPILPYSFQLLMLLTFPASSARVKTQATERLQAIYPLLKEVALSGAPGSKLMKQATQEIFRFSLILTGRRNPVLAKETTSIAIWSLTENEDCCKQWERLYWENKEARLASVIVLKKLVDEWNAFSLKLASSPSHKSKLRQTMETIRLKIEKTTTEGGAIDSLSKEADKSFKVISGRLFRESSCLKGTAITAVVLAAVVGSWWTHWICT